MATKRSARKASLQTHEVREQIVVLDRDLAAFYGIRTRGLNQQVKRNPVRFPEDFAFRLTREEWAKLRADAALPRRRGGGNHLPRVFTEQGVGMLASVLRGSKAIRATIGLLRAFSRPRREAAEELNAAEVRARARLGGLVDAVVMSEDEQPFVTPEGVTYFLQGGAKGLIKIGATRNLATRLRSLQMMSPVTLRLLGVVPADIEDECHRVLAPWRVHGEWFLPNRQVRTFIRKRCTVKSNAMK